MKGERKITAGLEFQGRNHCRACSWRSAVLGFLRFPRRFRPRLPKGARHVSELEERASAPGALVRSPPERESPGAVLARPRTMRRYPTSTLFLAGLFVALVLLLAALRILRWVRPSGHDVMVHEIRHMVATLQGSLEAMPGIPGATVGPIAIPGAAIGLAAAALVGLVGARLWILRRGAQQRSRNNPS